MKLTKNLPLVFGIALPIIFILVISLVVFIPSLYVNPQHNFLYMTSDVVYGNNQMYSQTYVVVNDHIALKSVVNNPNRPQYPYVTYRTDNPPLYLYDVKNNSSHQITFDEAKKILVVMDPMSPDGYTVTYRYSNGGIFEIFGGNNTDSRYVITKGNGSKKLDGLLPADAYYSPGNFTFLGWVK